MQKKIFSWSKAPKPRLSRVSAAGLRRFSGFSVAACTDRVSCEPGSKNIGSEMEPQPMPEVQPVEVDETCCIESGQELVSDSESPLSNEQKLKEQIVFLQHTYLRVCKREADAKAAAKQLEASLEVAKMEVERLRSGREDDIFSYSNIKEKPRLMKFYTSVDAKAFQFIIDLMGDSVWFACRHTIMDTTNFEGLCRCGRKRYL